MTIPKASRWNRFWFARVDGLPLGFVRIGFAVAALVWWGGIVPNLRAYYANPPVFPISSARGWSSEWVAQWLMPDALDAFPAVAALATLLGCSLVFLLLGWWSRAAAVAAWLLIDWFQLRNPTFLNAGDSVLRLTGLYLALAFLFVDPEERALSLDRRIRARGSAPDVRAHGSTRIPAWPLRLLQVQVCVIYVVSGLWKLSDPAWRDGSALWIALANPAFSRFGPPGWAPQALFAAGTLMVILWEILFPLLVAARKILGVVLGFGVLMHLFILVFLNTGVFPLAMLALYPAFLQIRGVQTRSAEVPEPATTM